VAITFGSINTGLPPNIVDQLIEAERIPIKNIEVQKSKVESKLKLVDDLTNKVSDIRKTLGELASTRGFSDVKLTSGDPGIISGTVDPETFQPGNWNIEVIELARKAAVLTNGFPDKDKTTVGVGYFRFKTPNGDKDVYINSRNNTLQGVANAINAANVGVRASVVVDHKDKDYPYKLMLTANGVGKENAVEYPRLYFLDGDQDIFFDSEIEATNGLIKVDGIEIEVSDNVLKDVIPGVTLELKSAAPGKQVNITVKEDLEVISGKVKSFVDGLNSVLSFIQQQNKIDGNTDTTRTLGGDSLLRTVEQRLRSLIQSPQYGINGEIKTLNQLGIQFNRNGTLDFDQKKFDAALASNPQAVQEFFVGNGYSTGFIASVRREISNLLNPAFGPLSNRSRGLRNRIEQYDQQIDQKERQLARREQILRQKFARLEETMSKLRQQGSAVGQMGGGGMMGLIQSGG